MVALTRWIKVISIQFGLPVPTCLFKDKSAQVIYLRKYIYQYCVSVHLIVSEVLFLICYLY